MKYRTVTKQSEGCWIRQPTDPPGVKGQGRTGEDLLESLKINVADMLVSKGSDNSNVDTVIPEAGKFPLAAPDTQGVR